MIVSVRGSTGATTPFKDIRLNSTFRGVVRFVRGVWLKTTFGAQSVLVCLWEDKENHTGNIFCAFQDNELVTDVVYCDINLEIIKEYRP